MDFSLANYLKMAGYPQQVKRDYLLRGGPDASQSVYVPELSELIEECGDIILYKIPKENQYDSMQKNVWVADSIGSYFCADASFVDTELTGCIGDTAIEAVARLYLHLKNFE